MAAVESSSNLVDLIETLETQRNEHAEASAALADTLAQIGSLLGSLIGGQQRSVVSHSAPAAALAPKPARMAAASSAKAPAASRRSKRNRFAVTGDESVLAFIRKRGNPSTSEVQEHWASEGRGASADNSLSKLYREKKIKREANKEGRGSRYTAV